MIVDLNAIKFDPFKFSLLGFFLPASKFQIFMILRLYTLLFIITL